MPSHRKHSISTLLAVAGAAAIVALLMNRHVMQAQHSGGESRRRPGEGEGRGQDAPAQGFAAISPAAAPGAEADASGFVRPAGPEAMRDAPRRGWDATDEASDESFPASDPPGNY